MIREQWLSGVIVPAAIWSCGDPQGPPPPPPPPPPPSATITALSPASTVAGGPDLTLTITGTNLRGPGISVVLWEANGNVTPLATTVVSSTEVTALVPAVLLDEPGT